MTGIFVVSEKPERSLVFPEIPQGAFDWTHIEEYDYRMLLSGTSVVYGSLETDDIMYYTGAPFELADDSSRVSNEKLSQSQRRKELERLRSELPRVMKQGF